MAANQPPRRPSWRDKVEAKATATPKGGRAWQSHKLATASVKAGWSRRTRLLMAAMVFVGLTGALIWVATLLRPPRPACLVLLGASYDDNLALPHNLQGWQSLEDLAQLTKRPESTSWLSWLGSGAIHLQHINNQMADDATWKKGWDDFTEHAVIVFVSLHGGADGKGPFLFLDERAGSKKLYLDQVLEHLESGKLRDKNKLLILDATQVQAKWQRGQLLNDFVRQLKDLLARDGAGKSGGNLFVLCATDVGQRSWVAENWQQTAFAHFVAEGLKGAADKNGDARVTVSELSHYVHDQVKQWVHDNRDAVQEPLLLGDEKSAEGVELVKIEKPYEEPSREENHVKNVDLSGLEANWKHCEELRADMPSPAVYTPQLWRQYLDTLLRYEQIVRAGDPTGRAASLKEGLAVLETEIAKARRLPLVSTGNSLPMAAAYGQAPNWPETELRDLRVDDLWKNLVGKDQKSDTWKKVKAWADGRPESEKRLLRVHLIGQMLAELNERPVAKADLKRAHDALALLGDDGGLRPVEAHYLAMLYRDLPSPEPTPEIVRLALQTRLLAERAALGVVMPGDPGSQPLIGKQGASDLQGRRYPYSEAIFPWIQKQVDAGDQERWQGENLLFASGVDYWKQASAHFSSAKALYEKALADASLLQAALQIRDTVFANLPYYTEWLVGQQVNGETDARRTEALLKTVEQLWQEAHALAGNLEKPNPNGQAAAFPQDKRSLAERTAEIVRQYQEIQEDFDRTCQELDRDARLQRAWQKTEEALLVPFIPAAQRLHLLLNSRDFSTRLSLAQTKKESGLPPVADPVNESLEAGRRQGRAAVAMLGEPWLTEIEQSKLLDLITKPGSAQAAVSLTEAGVRIEDSYKRLREETVKQQQAGNSNPNLVEAAPQVALAHRYSRLLDGAAVALIKNDPYGPGDAHHRLDLHHLLLWQINRTVDDHWFAESTAPEAQPYYLAAANSFLQDARELAKLQDDPVDKQRLVGLEKLKAERCKRTGLTVRLQGKSPLFMTSDRQTIYWESKADAGLPPGEPVFWLDLQGQVKTSLDASGVGRKPKTNGREGALAFPLESPLRQDQMEASASRRPLEGVAALRGRFRGQILDNSTDVRIQLIPDTVVYRYPESNAAGFAVRAAEDVQQGVLSVVMDASGSMGIDDGKPWSKDKKCKYHDATQALRGVLRKLPYGTKVNVWVLGGGYDHDRKETPIRALREEPLLWNPDNKRQLENLIDEVEEIKPEGASPIARAMEKALKKDLLRGVGIKTMLVLTDGDDNESKVGDIPEFLQKEFGGKSVFLHMVFFGVVPKERKNAEDQFGKIDELFPGRGRARFVEDAADLAVRLEEALIPKVRLLQNGKSVPSAPPQGYRVSFDEDKDLRWSGELKPSNYEALVYNTFKQDLALTPGDRLLILLRRKGNQIAYERAVFAREENNRRRPRREKDDWLAAVLQNGHFATDGSLRLLLTLEDLSNRQPQDGDFLKQSKPGFRWIQVKPRGGQEQSGLRWGNDERYPAPAWKINMMDWPVKDGNAPAPAELEIWWNRDPLPPSHGVLDHVENRTRENVRVDDQSVVVESFFVPERIVSITPDSRAKKSCLILRVTHDPKKPVFARLIGHSGGEQHDFFREAGQYTAIFWGVDEVKAKKFRSEFTSLEKFKADAHHVLFDDLAPPTAGDRGPSNVPLDKAP
jgi:hypothetical protein